MKASIFSILSILFVKYVSASDPTCQNGIVGNAFVNGEVIEDVICCSDECDYCGGTGCGDLLAGSSNCCGGPIFESGVSCDDSVAPCVIESESTGPVNDPTCEFGIITDNICCSSECDYCGGVGCGALAPGGSNCCGGPIVASGVSCDDSVAPCVIESTGPAPGPAPVSDPTCEFGLLNNGYCCHPECDFCGGTGCGDLPQGAANCCGSSIVRSGLTCDDNVAPCLVV